MNFNHVESYIIFLLLPLLKWDICIYIYCNIFLRNYFFMITADRYIWLFYTDKCLIHRTRKNFCLYSKSTKKNGEKEAIIERIYLRSGTGELYSVINERD